MGPAIFFPGKDDAIISRPEQLIIGDDIAKDAASAFVGAPDFGSKSGGDIGDAYGPWPGAASWTKCKCFSRCWGANESDLFAVGRPDWLAVSVDACVEIANTFRYGVVDADEAVVAAVANKGKL